MRLMSPSTLAHTPSLSTSRGHLPVGGLEHGAVGVGGIGGFGVGQVPQELTMEKKRRFMARKRAAVAVELVMQAAISKQRKEF